MSKIFCGIGKIPKGSRRGTMKECLETKQVRYWGQIKIDSRTLQAHGLKDTIKETRDQLIIQNASSKGTINRLSGRVTEIENKIAKKKATSEDLKKLPGYKKDLASAKRILQLSNDKLRIVIARDAALKKLVNAADKKKLETKIKKSKKALKLTQKEAVKITTIKQRKTVLKKAVKEEKKMGKKRAALRTIIIKRAPTKSTKGIVKKTGTKRKTKR